MHKGTPAFGAVAAAIFTSGRLDGEATAFIRPRWRRDFTPPRWRRRTRSSVRWSSLGSTRTTASPSWCRGLGESSDFAISVAVCCPLNPKVTPGELGSTIEALQITAVVDVDISAVIESIAAGNGLPTLSLMPGGGFALIWRYQANACGLPADRSREWPAATGDDDADLGHDVKAKAGRTDA